MDVSVIVPIHNGGPWIQKCFESILSQAVDTNLNFEVCICNDASTDNTESLLNSWEMTFQYNGISMKVFNNVTGSPKGVGYAKNKAVSISSGEYLCFQDVDDVMLLHRISLQYNRAIMEDTKTIIGCKFKREPEDSTARYTKWANNLNEKQLNEQVFTSHGPTVIMPTWFCHRSVFRSVGGFSEDGTGTPEDLIFFYKHLDLGGKICRVDECLLIYTYHPGAATFSIHEDTIWIIRIERLQRTVLNRWRKFTIWNAGKQGRKFYNSLNEECQKKVDAMCDVDSHKIGKKYKPFDPNKRKEGRHIDVVHYKDANPPFVICVKMDLTSGAFEENLKSLNLQENVDYVLFS